MVGFVLNPGLLKASLGFILPVATLKYSGKFILLELVYALISKGIASYPSVHQVCMVYVQTCTLLLGLWK